MQNFLLVLGTIFWLSAGVVCAIIVVVKIREAREWREYERLQQKRKHRPF